MILHRGFFPLWRTVFPWWIVELQVSLPGILISSFSQWATICRAWKHLGSSDQGRLQMAYLAGDPMKFPHPVFCHNDDQNVWLADADEPGSGGVQLQRPSSEVRDGWQMNLATLGRFVPRIIPSCVACCIFWIIVPKMEIIFELTHMFGRFHLERTEAMPLDVLWTTWRKLKLKKTFENMWKPIMKPASFPKFHPKKSAPRGDFCCFGRLGQFHGISRRRDGGRLKQLVVW